MNASSRPYLTSQIPGIGGEIRTQSADFQVEEIPLYEPSGQGSHLYLLLEKEGIDTLGAMRRLAKAMGIPEARFGYAGIKDAHAITRQRVSVESDRSWSTKEFADIAIPGIRILDVARHGNKLKLGHLLGNRFEILVRNAHDDALNRTSLVLESLAKRGLPNFFGAQRFGVHGNTHRLGRAWLMEDPQAVFDLIVDPVEGRGRFEDPSPLEAYRAQDYERALESLPSSAVQERRAIQALRRARGRAERAIYRLDRRLKRLAISAYQSRLFNEILERRMPHIDRLEPGDLAYIHGKGAVFAVEDVAVEQDRADAFEISPSGPLFGVKMIRPKGEVDRREREILEKEDLPDGAWAPLRKLGMKGARRPLRVKVEEPRVKAAEDGVLVSFSLPPGSYATVVLDELMKSGSGPQESPPE